MKKTFLVVLLLLSCVFIFAQLNPWLWATKAGGTSGDNGYCIAADASGNSYVTGGFEGTATFGSTTLTSNGEEDIFIAKLDSSGNWLWAKKAGGKYWDEGLGIAVDASGNIYITGYFDGTTTFGSTTLKSNGGTDIFIAKLDSRGNWLWATKAGGTGDDWGYGIAVDTSGNSYVTGGFDTRATASFDSITLTNKGVCNIFVAKLNSSGNWLWVKNAGVTVANRGLDIAVGASGNSYITGYFYGTATFGATTLTSNGYYDIFVAKLDSSGNWLWVKNAGGTYENEGRGIAVDASGNSYVTGWFEGSSNFGSTTLTSSGISDIFIAKLDSNGNWLWAKKAGGTDYDGGSGIAVDASGNSYVTGDFEGTATFGATTLTSSGDSDIFIAKLDSSGNWLWAKKAGGTNYDFGNGIAVDASGNSYVTGDFYGTATDGAAFGNITIYSSDTSLNSDIFVAKVHIP